MTSSLSTWSPAALERHLLDLFAPPAFSPLHNDGNDQESRVSIWRLDAVHRAKNYAQSSLSLANFVTHPSARWAMVGAATPARSLAQTYDALTVEVESAAVVPCRDMIVEVATKLTLLFGRARGIGIEVSGPEIFIAPTARRTLILICSELIINALKHAFPVGGPGQITITLARRSSVIEMVVDDDGVGAGANHGAPVANQAGNGDGLLDSLASVSGAALRRDVGCSGTGLRVTAHISVDRAGNVMETSNH